MLEIISVLVDSVDWVADVSDRDSRQVLSMLYGFIKEPTGGFGYVPVP